MKIYRCVWEFDDGYVEKTPYFRTVGKAKDYFWETIHKEENASLLKEILEYYGDYHEEDEPFEDFVYSLLDGMWDGCGGYETAEFID